MITNYLLSIIWLFDLAPDIDSTGGIVGGVVAIVFFLIFAAAAFITYKMIRRTVKMAFRLAIVGILLLIAVVGSISVYWFGFSNSNSPKPIKTRPNK
jgi:multisubunit Na+/H+ antiporter MnhB subunit